MAVFHLQLTKITWQSETPFYLSLPQSPATPKVKTLVFMKQAGVWLEAVAYRHVDSWRASCYGTSLLSPQHHPLGNLIMLNYPLTYDHPLLLERLENIISH